MEPEAVKLARATIANDQGTHAEHSAQILAREVLRLYGELGAGLANHDTACRYKLQLEAAQVEISKLKNALLESPLAAEQMKQLPNAMRLHTAETDALRAKLKRAIAWLDSWNSPDENIRPGYPWSKEETDELRKLLG